MIYFTIKNYLLIQKNAHITNKQMKFSYMPLSFHFHCAFYIPGNVQHICVAMTFIYQSWHQFGYAFTKLTKINTTFYKNALPPWNLIKTTMYKIFKNICYLFLNSMTQKYIYRHILFFILENQLFRYFKHTTSNLSPQFQQYHKYNSTQQSPSSFLRFSKFWKVRFVEPQPEKQR